MANKSEEADLLRGQVTDAVAELCMGGLSWRRQIKVEGLLAVTLDDNEVVVVHVNKTCPVPFSSTAHQNGSQLDLNCESGSDTEGQQHVTIKVEKELEQYPSRMNEDGQHQAKCTKARKKYGKKSRSVAESGQGDLSVQEKKPKTDTSVSSLRLSTPSYATDSSSILVAHTEADLCVHSGTEQPDSMQVPTEWSSVQNKKMPPTNILETKGEGISQTEACFYPEGNLVSNDGDSIAVPASLCDEIATGEVQDADKMLGLCLTSDLDQPETSCQPTDQEASCSSTVANTETTRPKKVKTRKRKQLLHVEKLQIIAEFTEKTKQTELAKKYGVSQSAISRILTAKEAYLKGLHVFPNTSQKRRRLSNAEDVDLSLFDWYETVKDTDTEITMAVLQRQAEELARRLNRHNFKAGYNWLSRWKKRHGIK